VKVFEPWVSVKIITPSIYISSLMPFLYEHEAVSKSTENFGDNRSSIRFRICHFVNLMRNFFDDMKSLTSGYASISYEIGEYKEADVVRMDFIVADEVMPAFCRVVSRRRVEDEAKITSRKITKINS
jgi:GTP-binding protein LepA